MKFLGCFLKLNQAKDLILAISLKISKIQDAHKPMKRSEEKSLHNLDAYKSHFGHVTTVNILKTVCFTKSSVLYTLGFI